MSNGQISKRNGELSDLVTEDEIARIKPPKPVDFEAVFELFEFAREMGLSPSRAVILFDTYNAIRQYGAQGWNSMQQRISEHILSYVLQDKPRDERETYIRNRMFGIMGYSVAGTWTKDEIKLTPLPNRPQRFSLEQTLRASVGRGFALAHGAVETMSGDLYMEEIVSVLAMIEQISEGQRSRIAPLLNLYNDAKTGKVDTEGMKRRLAEIGINLNSVNDAAEALQLQVYRAEIAMMQGTHPYSSGIPQIRKAIEILTSPKQPSRLGHSEYLALLKS